MPELCLKVGSVSVDPRSYQDGDILCAFNRRHIRCVHAQHICHVKNAGGGRGAHRNPAHVAKDFFEHTHQYRFDRVSRTEIRRVTLADLTEVLIDGTPRRIDGKMQHMDVERYIQHRLEHDRHKIFGAPGFEVWYGGRTDVSHAKLDLVWAAIEAKTPELEANYPRWPAGEQDLRSHLFVAVDDFDDDEANVLVAPELDETDPENSITLRKRLRYVDWRDSVPTRDHAAIENRTTRVDAREVLPPLVRGDVVKTRTAPVVVGR